VLDICEGLIWKGVICATLLPDAASEDHHEGILADTLTSSVLPGCSDPKPDSLPDEQLVRNLLPRLSAEHVPESATKAAIISVEGQVTNKQDLHTDHHISSVMTPQPHPSESLVVNQPTQHQHTTSKHREENNHGTLHKRWFSCFCFQE